MMSELNIVELIEQNPISRLTNTYQNKLLEKIKNNFIDTEQQLFIASFYGYLHYHPTNDYVIDLDNVWKWLGFNQKYNAKRLLENNFTIEKDYRVLLLRKEEQTGETPESTKRGGHNKEKIMMTIQSFKLFCLKAGTKKADQIHEYYIKLEQTLHEVINEECIELKQQLQNQLMNTQIEKETIREKTLLEQFPPNKQCIYYALIDNKSNENEPLIKFGSSNDLTDRIKRHRRCFNNFRLINVFAVNNKTKIENAIKHHPILSKYRRTIQINDDFHTELIAIQNLTFENIDKIIKDIIHITEYSPENYKILLKENEELKQKMVLMTEEIEKLTIENKKLQRKYIIKQTTDTNTPENTILNPVQQICSLKRLTKSKDGLYHVGENTFEKYMSNRTDVWNGKAYQTTGELKKDDLMINKLGKIVSKKKFIYEKQNNRLEDVNLQRKIKSNLKKNATELLTNI